MSIGKNLYFFIKIKSYFFIQWIKTIFKYYSNYKFMLFDILFGAYYLFINPYRVSRKFLQKKFNQKIYDYGETPLTQIDKIVKNFQIQKNSKILELGAGRGKVSFWLYFFYNCEITAIERIPTFVKIAAFFTKIFKIKNLRFLCGDFFNFEFLDYDIIYLYGTTLSDANIETLITKFKKLPSSTNIITVSYSLNEYDDSFKIIKDLDITFPWGKTKVYLNAKRS